MGRSRGAWPRFPSRTGTFKAWQLLAFRHSLQTAQSGKSSPDARPQAANPSPTSTCPERLPVCGDWAEAATEDAGKDSGR